MKSEELDKIIEQLENATSKDKATFGLYYREGENEMHLKANKDGFELFAVEMLKASRDSESIIQNAGKKHIDFGSKEKWIQGELIAYIKPIFEARNEVQEEEPYERTFKNYALKYGCFAIIGMVIVFINWVV